MSDGSGFDMTLLEGKDRAELAAIAESLGQKPGARAKKADIVTLIMRLVGADEGTPTTRNADSETAATASPAGDEEQAAPNEASGAEQGDRDEGDAAEGDDASAEVTPEAGDPGRRGGGRNGGQGNQNQGPRDQGGRNQGNQNQGNQNQGNQNQGNQDDGGDAPNGNQRDPQSEQDVDGESGNRRRRRRGRDRDRRPEGDEQAPVEPVEVEGLVDLRDEGYGFLRLNGYLPSRDDAYISVKQTRQFGLRTGDVVRGKSRPPARNEKNPALLQVDAVNGHEAHNQPPRPRFDELTAVFPDQRLSLELPDDPSNATVRMIDLLAPIGKGARGLIVAPPASGATTVLKNIVRSVEVNHPDVELIVLLVDERPEEVTEMKRWLLRGSVASSTFDRPAEELTSIAELVIERAKRLVEAGKDVVVVLDGLTALTRAYNLASAPGGRTIDGVDTGALYPPKQFFGAARNAEEGGSLTILATIEVETGSAIDELIFEEFDGTATMQLKLDRHLAGRGVHPAIDIAASGTRHEDRLLERDQGAQIAALRSLLAEAPTEPGSNAAGLESLVTRLASSKSNAELLAKAAKG